MVLLKKEERMSEQNETTLILLAECRAMSLCK